MILDVEKETGAELVNWRKGFTLVELLVVMAILTVLMGILLPSLSRARQHAKGIVCRSNIRQLYFANAGYCSDNDGFYVRAAYDIWEGSGGRNRWHGVRKSLGVDVDPEKNTFDPSKGPLKNYLGNGQVKECPAVKKFVKEGSENAFEAGCGGYGYNSVGVGSRCYEYGYCDKAMRQSIRDDEIRQAFSKVMFTDTSFVEEYPGLHLIEYSFCEPPRFVFSGGMGIIEVGRPVPSIHFRHLERANVAYCDGHISSEEMEFSKFDDQMLSRYRIGWFGPEDNELFRPY